MFFYSSLAQSVEHLTVNQGVVGSSPTGGAFFKIWPHGQAVKTSPFHGGNTGSIPVGVTIISYADVAQLAEQLTCNQQVIGSIPIVGFFHPKDDYGWIPEWPKGTDCKSAAICFGGSNPPPPIFLI